MRTFLIIALCCIASPAMAQVVQLPTFHQFSVSTTVSVPDSGAGVIGGVDRGEESAMFAGPMGSRMRHRALASSRAGIHARITDFDEIDKDLLGKAEEPLSLDESVVASRAGAMTRGIHAAGKDASVAGSVAQLRKEYQAKQQLAREQTIAEVKSLVARGDRALREGKNGPARVYYQNAYRQADESLKKVIKQRLQQVTAHKSPTRK